MIKKIRIVGHIAVVTATADFNPLRQLNCLTGELCSLKFKGHVLFDLLSVNGLSHNRFVTIDFDGKTFDRQSFCVESNIELSLMDEQNSLIKQDSNLLNDSVLSESEVHDFLH